MSWQVKRTIDEELEFYWNKDSGEVSWEKPKELLTEEELADLEFRHVWVPSHETLWQPAKVVGTGTDGSTTVQTESGESMVIPANGMVQSRHTRHRKVHVPLWEVNKSNLRFLEDDCVMLDPVNEAFIVYNLQKRYDTGKIYTWVGASKSVLVSINPYEQLGIYSAEHMDLHRKRPPNRSIPPHVFDVANGSYDSMAFKHTNQSILISGESGAGKTEATKQCLSFLAYINEHENTQIEEKVLSANPLLEAFGNAKTIRNINSSRFGKWMEIYFDKKTTQMVGSRIYSYLLERNRVVTQQQNERNFHIFYALFANENARNTYGLTTPEDYHYLNQSGCTTLSEFNDATNFQDVSNAMDVLQFSAEEKQQILRITAGILTLGNVDFDPQMQEGSVDGSKVKDAQVLQRAAELLDLDIEALRQILTFRTIAVGVRRGAPVPPIPLDVAGAKIGRDSLAMGIYGRLFLSLVESVNKSFGENGDKSLFRFMGILDIFGFEIFDNNSFEQLCINFANETLQQLFNQTTFKEEEQLYMEESVPYEPIKFKDNQKVLDLISGKRFGILTLLDDEIKVPGGDDMKFVHKVEEHHRGSEVFIIDTKRRFKNALSFEIEHYAGNVKYDASRFMAKNVDTVFRDMHDALSKSKNELLASLFRGEEQRIRTISHQFRGQLKDLMDTLSQTESRFIRCIKPNGDMLPKKLEPTACVDQLRYSGVFEAVDIRKKGYPFRYGHRQFAYRYGCINLEHTYAANANTDVVGYCREILSAAKADLSGVQIGRSRVLYRAKEHKLLYLLRSLALEILVPKMQSVMRRYIVRKFTVQLSGAQLTLEDAMDTGHDYNKLASAIDTAKNAIDAKLKRLFNYPIPNLNVATRMLKELENQERLQKQMEALVAVEDPNTKYEELKQMDRELASLVKGYEENLEAAKDSKDFYGRIPYRKPKLSPTQEDLWRQVKKLIQQCVLGIIDRHLAEALKTYNREMLLTYVEKADQHNHVTDDVRKARDLLVKMEELDEDAKRAVLCMSRTMMEEVLENAKALRQSNQHTKAVEAKLRLEEREFVQEEYERAIAVGDMDRKVHRELKLMEFKYDSANKQQYDIKQVPGLRQPEDYSTRAKRREAMLTWEKKVVKKSLTVCPAENQEKTSDTKAAIKAFKKKSLQLHKWLLTYMGDKRAKPAAAFQAGQDFLREGMRAFGEKENDTLKEMYMLLFKQLRANESTDKAGESRAKGIGLLGMCLLSFSPSTIAYSIQPDARTFDDFVALYIMNDSIFAEVQKSYITAMHNVKYDPSQANRSVNLEQLLLDLKSVPRRFSLEKGEDSGPTDVALYLKAPVELEPAGTNEDEEEGEEDGDGEEYGEDEELENGSGHVSSEFV